jgi:HYR domain
MKKVVVLLTALFSLIGPSFGGVVTTLSDDGPGSLRAAVASGGTITFSVTGTITLTSGEIAVPGSINIVGPGADQLTIQRSSAAGTPEFRLFNIRGSAVISGVTLSNGLIGVSGEYDNGGTIYNQGSLTLINCAVADNHSVGSYTRGTGVFNASSARMIALNCLFARNTATGFDSEGSAIYNNGALALTNCTFSGNSAGYTAAIQNDGFSSGLTIESCTIVSNTARFTGGIYNGGAPGVFAGKILIRNSIVVGNSGWEPFVAPFDDIENRGIITSGGFNLIGIELNDPIQSQLTDRTGVTPDELHIGPLADNGGPTATHALLLGSPALDSGPLSGFPLTDQRGVPRPFGPRPDIGAFESDLAPPLAVTCPTPVTLDATSTNGAAATLSVSVIDGAGNAVQAVWFINGIPRQTNSITANGGPTIANVSFSAIFPLGLSDVVVFVSDGAVEAQSCSTAVNVRNVFAPQIVQVNSTSDSGFASLRHAILSAPTNGTIVFGVTGVIDLTRGELYINKPLKIVGPGANLLTIQRSEQADTPEFRIFELWSGPVTISGLTIRNGYLSGTHDDDGAGILNWTDLELRDCVIADNRVGGSAARGAGLQNFYQGSVGAANCTFVNNHCLDSGSEGGAIYNYRSLTLVNCTLTGNSAGNSGGALHNDALSSNVVIRSCTIVSNSAPQGSALYNNGFSTYNGIIDIQNSIVAANAGQFEIYNRGVFFSGGHNLLGHVNLNGTAPQPTDRVDVTAEELHLGPLQNNGGSTPTHALLSGSVAIDGGDAGSEPNCLPADQRGVARPHYAACDIGAFEADQLPPILSAFPVPHTFCGSTGSETVNLSFSVRDPDGDGITIVWFVNGIAYQTNTIGGGQASLDGAIVSFAAIYPIGSHSVAISAWDGKSDPATAVTEIVVGDSIPPAIACQTNIVTSAEPGQCSAVVNFGLPAVADNCGISSVACFPAPGKPFPIGNTQVTCTARDIAGNKSSCSFSVTVVDREAPRIVSISASPALLSPANHQMVPVVVRVSAGDNCSAVTSRIIGVTSSDPASGTSPADRSPDWQITGPLTLELRAEQSRSNAARTYTITVQSRDASGNVASRNVNVVVPAHGSK